MTPSPPVIDAQGVTRRFGDRVALSGVTFQVQPGEVFGLLGPDGAGKTTLLQVLAAILDPSEGHCSVLGFDVQREDAKVNAQVGYMSQGFTLYERLSVDENLRFAARIRGVTASEYKQRSRELLSMAGLANFRARWAENLSGGMRKKLSLCCSLVHRPKLLLLDELSLGVDPVSRRDLWEMLHTFRSEGVTIVLSTPYMGEAARCDRLCFLEGGQVLAVDEPGALAERAVGTTYEIVGISNDALAALEGFDEVAAVIAKDSHLRVRTKEPSGLRAESFEALPESVSIEPVAPTLEDAFLYLSGRAVEKQPAGARISGVDEDDLPSAAPEVSVSLAGVTCKFGSFVALDDVTLSVNRGEVFGFLGPNGAGKTTLIRILCGMLRPTSGSATVAGIDVLRNPRLLANRVGYMSQRFSLYPDLTCSENLSFFGGVYGLRGRGKTEAIRDAAGRLDIGTDLDRRVSSLSGAVRQRLALACSVLHGPDVLFLDEPTSGVDPVSRHRFWQLIKTQAEQGMTVFVTTHYLEEATNCDQIGLLSAGRLLASGTLEELRAGLGADSSATMEDVFMGYVLRTRETAGAEA